MSISDDAKYTKNRAARKANNRRNPSKDLLRDRIIVGLLAAGKPECLTDSERRRYYETPVYFSSWVREFAAQLAMPSRERGER